MNTPESQKVQFGVFEVDLATGELRKAGTKVKLQDQPFQILSALLERPGEIVSREDLRQKIWRDDTFIDFDQGLSKAVNKIREALGDSADNPRFVETLARRGYRFIAPVERACGSAMLVGGSSVAGPKRRAQISVLAIFATLVLVSGWSGFQLYKWLVAGRPDVPFQKVKITSLTSTGTIMSAAVSPDGEYVAYVTSEAGMASLRLRQVLSSSSVQIGPPAKASYAGLTFSRDGSLLYYVKDDENIPPTLYESPVLGGAVKKVIADVGGQITLSPDGSRLAFIRNLPGSETAVIVANADGTAEQKLITGKKGQYFSGAVAWSPDGRTIAFGAGSLGSDIEAVLTVPAEGGLAKPITLSKWFHINHIAWLPNGRALILIAPDQRLGHQQIWYLSYPGGEVQRIVNDPNDYTDISLTSDARTLLAVQRDEVSSIWIAQKGEASSARQITTGASRYDGASGVAWAPDNRIVYGSRSIGSVEIWIMNLDGSNRRQLASDGRFPRVSPDGRHVVFTSDRAGIPHIWRVEIDGSNPEQLTNGQGESQADCSPDGKWLVYSAPDKGWTLWKAPSPEGPAEGHPVQLNQSVGVDPSISPDGKMIAFNYNNGRQAQPDTSPKAGTPVIPFEGGPPIRLIDGEMPVHWTSDGSAVLYVGDSGGVANIWSQPIAGGRPKQLTEFKTDEIFAFDWSRDGKQLALVRGTGTNDAVLIRDLK